MTSWSTLLFVGGCVAFAGAAHGHEAPSGWSYPTDCCAQNHCRPVACDALVEKRDGIHFLGVVFSGAQVRMSGDNSCHVCIVYSNDRNGDSISNPICAFIKPDS